MSKFANTRVWFITGCSQGLGRSLAEAVLKSGERLVATLRKPDAFGNIKPQYSEEQLLVLPLDVTIPAQIDSAFEKTKTHFGRLDVVVNNAGYGLNSDVEAAPENEARKVVEVLFWAAVNITKKAVVFFREVNPKGHGGRVLNISSVGGFAGQPTLSFYSSGKFALEGFTEAYNKELPPAWNIKLTIVEPGGFQTEWNGSSMVHIPPHPAYSDFSSPTMQRREYFKTQFKPQGDPMKGALAMIEISKVPDPPVRFALGADAVHFLKREVLSVLDELNKWEELSSSTVADHWENEMTSLDKIVK